MIDNSMNDLMRLARVLANGILPGDRECAEDFVRSCRNKATDGDCRGHESGTDVVSPNIRTVKDNLESRVYIDLPGAKKESIDASVDEGTRALVVTAERADSTQKYKCRITIGDTFDLDGMKTSYADGVLTVVVPKKATPQPTTRKLSID